MFPSDDSAARKREDSSDFSDADPQALLDSLMDLDDMDAEIFGSRKPKSDPAKPKSDPAKHSSLKTTADPLPKAEDKRTGPKTDTSPLRSPAKTLPVSKRRDDLDFEDDGDDIMDALGFGESQQITKKENDSTVRPARSKLDELLGRKTSPKLSESTLPGAKKEFKLDRKYQQMSGNVDLPSDEDTAFGSYQPTMTMNPERRTSSSVRFSKDTKEELKSDATTKAHGVNGGADWLGLRDEDIQDLAPLYPLKELSDGNSTGLPLASESKKENKNTPVPRTNQTTSQLKHNQTLPQPSEKNVTRPKDATDEEDDPWLNSVLAQKKIQKKVEKNGQKEMPGLSTSLPWESPGNESTSISPADRKEKESFETVLPRPTESHKESFEVIASLPKPVEEDKYSKREMLQLRNRSVTDLEAQAINSLPKPMEDGKYSTREKLQLQNRVTDHEAQAITYFPKPMEDDKYSKSEIWRLQNRVTDLEAQIRQLQLEKEQQSLLLDSLQKRHKEDLELVENAQRNRLKLLEDSAHQREERLHKECQELSARYLSLVQSAENEKSEMLSKYQLKLTEFQQEKDKEVERIRELQRLSVQEMCKDHEEQLKRIKCLKDQEIDAVTSASSKTRSLNGIIEQMEAFSHKLNDLSVQVETSHSNASQEIELGARQREMQFRALQERLLQHQKDMEEERNSLRIIISNMETRLNEQSRLIEEERWRLSAEQSKLEALQHSLEEQKRILTQQMIREREELEKAKSALLEEQQSVMKHCAEERRKLAAEWAELNAQQKLSKERAESDLKRIQMAESQRGDALLSLTKEQAELSVRAIEVCKQEEKLAAAREALEKERNELRSEKDRVFATAMHVRQRAEEVENMSKMALQHHEKGEKALAEARKVEHGHQDRLRAIQQQLDRLKQQEEHLLQEHKNLAHFRIQLNQLRNGQPTGQALLSSKPSDLPSNLLSESGYMEGMTFEEAKTRLNSAEANQGNTLQTSDIYTKLTLLKLSAQKDRDFLEDEQLFLDALKKSNIASQNV